MASARVTVSQERLGVDLHMYEGLGPVVSDQWTFGGWKLYFVRLDAGQRCGRGAMVRLEEVTHHSDTQTLQGFADAGREVRHRPIDAGRIEGIVPRHGLQEQRAILGRPGHGAGMVQRECEQIGRAHV